MWKKALCGLTTLFLVACEEKHADYTIDHVWARAQENGNSALFMEIHNPTHRSDALISVEAKDVCEFTELHDHVKEIINDQEVFKMRPVKKMVIPAKGTLVLKPKSLHVMLMKLKKPLKEGDKIEVVLQFEKSPTHFLTVDIKKKECHCHDHPAK